MLTSIPPSDRTGSRPRTSNPRVTVNGQITRDRRVPGCSSATQGIQFPITFQVPQHSGSTLLHQRISFSTKQGEAKKSWQPHSGRGNTSSYQCAGDTTQWIIYFPNGYPHVINNEKGGINSPLGQMNNNGLQKCWIGTESFRERSELGFKPAWAETSTHVPTATRRACVCFPFTCSMGDLANIVNSDRTKMTDYCHYASQSQFVLRL